jgi:hypothetical protein
MSLLRLFVTVVVAVPLFLAVGWPHSLMTTLVIAFVSIGTGYGVEALVRQGKGPSTSAAGGRTDADVQWELHMARKKARAAEGRGFPDVE